MIDLGGDVARAKAVVDVDDGDAAGAGVEHREQRGEPAEVRAVADGGRHRDDRPVHEPAHDRGQRALHARDDHQRIGAHERFRAGEQAVQARHARVANTP